jgi:hypothetical protein
MIPPNLIRSRRDGMSKEAEEAECRIRAQRESGLVCGHVFPRRYGTNITDRYGKVLKCGGAFRSAKPDERCFLYRNSEEAWLCEDLRLSLQMDRAS